MQPSSHDKNRDYAIGYITTRCTRFVQFLTSKHYEARSRTRSVSETKVMAVVGTLQVLKSNSVG